MRKIFAFGTMLSLTLLIIACNNNTPQIRLKEKINQVQQKLPISLGETGEIIEISYNDTENLLTYSMNIDDSYLNHLDLADFARLYAASNPENIQYAAFGMEFIDILNLIPEVDCTLKYIFRTKRSEGKIFYSKEFSSECFPEDYISHFNTYLAPKYNSEENKNSILEYIQKLKENLHSNSSLYNDCIFMKDVKEENNNIVQIYECGANVKDINEDQKYSIKKYVFHQLEYSFVVSELYYCNYGVIIRVQMPDEKIKEFSFTPYELLALRI